MPNIRYDGLLAAESLAPTANLYGTNGVDTLVGTAAAESLWGGDGDRLIGGDGDDTYYLKASNDVVVELAGGGVDKIVSWSSVYLPDYANVENLEVGGDKTYGAGNASDNIIQGGAGSQQLYGGFGQDILIGGAGADTFIVVKGQGNDVIQDFAPGQDLVRLSSGYTTFAAVQLHLTQVGADVKLDMGDGDGLILRNVQASQLTAANFQLQVDPAALGALTFHDEFNGPLSLWDAQSNPTGTWRPDFGYQGEQGVGSYTLVSNDEKQVYTSPFFRGHNGDFADTPFVSNSDGTLSIRAKPSGSNEIFGHDYVSGMITTQPTFAQTYGYFEMRADLPQADGAWPAFWLIPADGSWPPELDVMETLSSDVRAAWTTEHSGVGGHTANGVLSFIPDTADGFHTYGVSWTATDLTWYIDGVEVFHSATPADMNKPMFMIANLALGGWGGAVDASSLPAEMKIDYIRAYALSDTVVATPAVPPHGETPATEAPVVVPPAVVQTAPDGGMILTGSGHADTLIGGAGADTVNAGQGPGVLTGGGGSDTFVFKNMPWNSGHITDFQLGGDKIDISGLYIDGYNGADPVADGYMSFVSDGADGTIVLLDTDGAGSANTIKFQIVTLDGVSPGTLTAASVLTGAPPSGGTAPTTGQSEAGITVTSTKYADTLIGGAGADTINAGQGPDMMTGGQGADTFVFKNMVWNRGHITDFQVGVDKIDISALYTDGYQGSDPVTDGYLSFEWNETGTTVLLDPDGPAAQNTLKFQIAMLDGVSPEGLTAQLVLDAPGMTAASPATDVELANVDGSGSVDLGFDLSVDVGLVGLGLQGPSGGALF